MARCSRPLYIPRPGLADRPSARPLGSDFPLAYPQLVVPCGKCMNCQKNRQDSFAFRIRAEAEKRGSLSFVTLTYNENTLPICQTFWRVNRLTGEAEKLSEPELVCYSRKEDIYGVRSDMSQLRPGRFPRYLDHEMFKDGPWLYFARYTPTVCRIDVQRWLKLCRFHFERKLGRTLNFTYAICSEYGPRTCRPHYHCCLMGLSEEDVRIMVSLWKFGFTDVKLISSSDFTKVADYVGKYISKGKFECDSVKDCTAFGTRMMTSKGLGDGVVEKYRSYFLAYNVIGVSYDPDTFWSQPLKRYLRRDEIAVLIQEVPKRLAMSFDGKRYYAIPRVLRNKIFYVKKETQGLDGKIVRYSRPSKLWKMVVDVISKQFEDSRNSEFSELVSGKSPREVAQVVAQFNFMQEAAFQMAEHLGEQNYKTKLSKSKL